MITAPDLRRLFHRGDPLPDDVREAYDPDGACWTRRDLDVFHLEDDREPCAMRWDDLLDTFGWVTDSREQVSA